MRQMTYDEALTAAGGDMTRLLAMLLAGSQRNGDLIPGPGGPATDLLEITPSDTTDLSAEGIRALRVGNGGNLTVIAIDGTDPITLANVANGETIVVAVKKVMATDTDCTAIVGLI